MVSKFAAKSRSSADRQVSSNNAVRNNVAIGTGLGRIGRRLLASATHVSH